MAHLAREGWDEEGGYSVRNLPYFTAAELTGWPLPAIGTYALSIKALSIVLAWIRGAVVGTGAMQTTEAAVEEQQ